MEVFMIYINLIPKPLKPETTKRLENARRAAFKLTIFHLKNENKLQEKLIEAYSSYTNFLEHQLHRFI
jgi:hypothetical protein